MDELMPIEDRLETQFEPQQNGSRQLLEALMHENSEPPSSGSGGNGCCTRMGCRALQTCLYLDERRLLHGHRAYLGFRMYV